MSEKIEQQYAGEPSQVYAQLKQQDVEQFYTGYQWWKIQQRIIALQAEIGTLRQQIDENAQYMQEVRPPAVALATLARLQANGVHDLGLLDRMLERGEGWLDLIVQRLDYCEQLEFIPDNYTQWCEHALEGAYDWIDSMRGADALTPSAASSEIVDLVSVEATEELLLRKLTSEEEEEEAQPLSPPILAIEEMQPITEEILATVEEFENMAEASLPEETDVIASPPGAFVEQDNAEILLPDEAVADEQETGLQDGDFAPAPDIQLPTAANAEADLSLEVQVEDVHSVDETSYAEDKPQELLQQEMEIPLLIEQVEDVHSVDETSYAEDKPQELFQQEMEIPLLIETATIEDASLVTEEQHLEQQTVEPALALDTPLPKVVEAEASPSSISIEQQVVEPAIVLDAALSTQADVADNPPVVSDDQDLNQQIVEPDSQPGHPIPTEADAERNPTTVPIEQGSEQWAAEPALILEDPSSFEGSAEGDSVQVPIDQVASPEDISVSATQETPLPTRADSSAAAEELHNEQVAETVPAAEVSLPVETNAEIASPGEAAPEGVHTVEGSISQQDSESAPAQPVKPRGFWRWLLALFRK